jgi:hypothetical protein
MVYRNLNYPIYAPTMGDISKISQRHLMRFFTDERIYSAGQKTNFSGRANEQYCTLNEEKYAGTLLATNRELGGQN